MLMLVVFIVDMKMLMLQGLMDMLMALPLGEMKIQPSPISAAERSSRRVTGSARSSTANTAPMKGASE